MKKWAVYMPINGYVQVEVEAETEEDAIDEAFEKGATIEDIMEWDMYEHIVEGNVFCGSWNDVEIDLLEDNNDEEEQ